MAGSLRALVAGILAAIVCAACAPAAAPSAPNGSPAAADPTSSPFDAPSATPTQAPIRELLGLTLDHSGPIIRPEDGPDGAQYALPATGARDRDGTYHLVVAWFHDGGELPDVSLASSTDTKTWRVSKAPLLKDLHIITTRPGPIPAALVQLDDGTWQMYGWAAE